MKCGGDLAAQINFALATRSEVDEPYGYVTMEEAQAMLGPDGVGNEIDRYEANQLENLAENSMIRWEGNCKLLIEANVQRWEGYAVLVNGGETIIECAGVGGVVGAIIGVFIAGVGGLEIGGVIGVCAGIIAGIIIAIPVGFSTTVEPVFTLP